MPVLKKGDDVYQDAYRDTMDALRTQNDVFFNIESRRYFDVHLGKDVWFRNASQAFELGYRPSHDALFVEKNNMLMRCLSRLRAIDYAISQTDNPSLDEVNSEVAPTSRRQEIRNELNAGLKGLQTSIDALSEEGNITLELMLKVEKDFNDFLMKQLHAANLTEGCLDAKQAERLLFHYRTLSSVLDPAMPLVTLTYDASSQILQREEQYPVTVKTDVQREEAQKLKQVIANPLKREKNSHTRNNLATQHADACFADSLVDDERMLSAQARKTHLVGVKNAFIVKTSTQFDVPQFGEPVNQYRSKINESPMQPLEEAKVTWLARAGVPVFMGKGETTSVINQHTQENLTQIEQAGLVLMGDDAAQAIHLTVLNTDTIHERQDKMLSSLRHEIEYNEENQHEMSNVPTNDHGTAFFCARLSLKIRDAFKARKGEAYFAWTAGQKATRLKVAVDAMLASIQAGYLSCVNCASGQDRTGTVVEKGIQEVTLEQWIATFEQREGNAPNAEQIEKQIKKIQEMRARGFNAAEIASHMSPGSPGMKIRSKANNWFNAKRTFGEQAEKEFYLESAETNKSNPVENVDFLSVPEKVARDEFARERLAFEKLLTSLSEHPQSLSSSVREAGIALNSAFGEFKIDEYESEHVEEKDLSIYQRAKRMRRSMSEAAFGASGKKSARDLAYMTATLKYASDAIKALKAGHGKEAERAIDHINEMQKILPGHEHFRLKLAAFVMTATAVLLIAAMFAFPPFGAFVFGSALAVSALTGILGTVAQVSAVSVLSYTAWGAARTVWSLWSRGQEQGKAEVVGNFKKMLKQENEHIAKESKSQPDIGSTGEEAEGLPDTTSPKTT